MKINPQIGFCLGEEIYSQVKELPKISAMQKPEGNDFSFSLIQSEFKNQVPDVFFRVRINSDLVIVDLTKQVALRIHNSFSTAPDSKETTLWTKYWNYGYTCGYVDPAKSSFEQMAEIDLMLSSLKHEIAKITRK